MLRFDLGEHSFGQRCIGAAIGDNAVGVAAGKRDRGSNGR